MCCYRDRTVSAISYEHLGSCVLFFSFMRTFNASILFLPIFNFANYSFCVNIQKTQTLVRGWEKSKQSQSKRLELLSNIILLFWHEFIIWHHHDVKNMTVNWIPIYYVLKYFSQKTQISTRTKDVLFVNTPLCYIVPHWMHKRHKIHKNFRINVFSFVFFLFVFLFVYNFSMIPSFVFIVTIL